MSKSVLVLAAWMAAATSPSPESRTNETQASAPAHSLNVDLAERLHPAQQPTPTATSTTTPTATEQQQANDLGKLREALRQPGPEARQQRENAAENLLRMKESEAHDILQERLLQGDDADGVSRMILRMLALRFQNAQDPVFGLGNKERSRVQRSYVPALVRFFAASRPEPAVDGVIEAVRDCLAAMPGLDRQEALTQILAGDDQPLRTAALRAAAETRDLYSARLLANWLDHPKLGDVARQSLQRLTFQTAPFASKEEYDRWYADNQNKTYLQLAEEMARRAQIALDRQRTTARERETAAIVELVQSYVGRETVEWKKIAARVLAPEPAGIAVATLRALRQVLGKEERFGGVAADRLAFLAELRKRLDQSPSGEERPCLLEVMAYLVAPTEPPALRQEVAKLLREALQSDALDVKKAAMTGLRRFYARDTLAAIIAQGQDAHTTRNWELLDVALGTLCARGWPPPAAKDENLPPWLELVGRTVLDGAVPQPLREIGLQMLTMRDADQKQLAEGFDRLLQIAANLEEKPVLREQAMHLLGNFSGEEERADRYVEKLIALLSDPSERVRAKAAELLQNLPAQKKTKVEEWGKLLLEKARERLLVEPDETAFAALLKSMERRVDAEGSLTEQVMTRLREAIDALAKNSADQPTFRRPLLVNALTTQAATPGLPAILWVCACESLLPLEARRELRDILSRQKPLTPGEGTDAETALRALRVLIQTALLKPKDEPWSQHKDEAGDVLEALNLGDKSKVPLNVPRTALLRVQILAGLGRYPEALDAAQRSLPSETSAELRAKLILLAARCQYELVHLAEALKLLESMPPNGGPEPQAIDLLEQIGAAFLKNGQAKKAVEVLTSVLAATIETMPRYRERFLLLIEAEMAADPQHKAESLARLRAKKELFNGSSTAEELRQRYGELERRLEN